MSEPLRDISSDRLADILDGTPPPKGIPMLSILDEASRRLRKFEAVESAVRVAVAGLRSLGNEITAAK